MKIKLLTLLLGVISLWGYAQADITENFDGAVFPQPGWSVVDAYREVLNASQGKGLKFDQYNASITTPPICNVSYIEFKTYKKVPLKLLVQEVGNPNNAIERFPNTSNGNKLDIWRYDLASFNGKIVTITFITEDDGSNGDFIGFLDDIRIVRASPEIDVDGYGFPIADNSTTVDTESGTDFGRQIIGDTEKVQRFTIKNTGKRDLRVTSASLTGTHASSFRLIAFSTNTLNPNFDQTSLPITVLPNNEIYVYVAFSPTSVGLKTANLNITSNDCDEQFYDFSIAGTAVECKVKILLFQNTFEENQNTSPNNYNYLPVAAGSSTLAYNPKANTNDDTSQWYPVNTPLYSPSKNTLTGVAGSRALLVSNETKTFTFGPVNISTYNNVAVSFEMAGISKTSDDGLDGDDMVKLYISSDRGTTWSYEAMIKGAYDKSPYDKSPNIKSNLKFPFSDADAHTNDRNYDGNNKEYYWGNIDSSITGVSNNELGTFVLSIPDQKKPNEIMIRLVVNTTKENEIWMIDNVQVMQRGAPVTKVWKGAWYDDNNTPTSEAASLQHRVIVQENYSSDVNGNLLACKCEINAGKSLVIKANQYAKVVGDITNNGTLTVENDGNLIQISDDAKFIGTNPVALVKRNASLKRLDYNYWGSPVAGQNVRNFSLGTLINRFYVYNESNDYFDGLFVKNTYPITSLYPTLTYSLTPLVDYTTYAFEAGKGYAVRAPNTFPTSNTNFEGTFVGVPNNGNISVAIKKSPDTSIDGVTYTHGNNLVSNPYPSNINIDKFFDDNPLLEKVAYFWTNINPTPEMQGSQYPKSGYINNYAVYCPTGGLQAPSAACNADNSNCSKTPNNILKVGQGFVVRAKNSGNVIFKNNIRNADNSGLFFNRLANNKDRFWLELKTPLNFVNPILIGYIRGATNNLDQDYDAKLLVEGADSFYSIVDNQKLAIQGKHYPFNDSDVIALGATFYEKGNHTISLKNKEGVFETEQPIYLHDKFMNTFTDLQKNDYTFTADKGEVKNRFEIIYNYKTLGSNEVNQKEPVVIYKEDNGFVIKASETITEVKVFDASGRYIKQQKVNAKSTQVLLPENQKGVLVFEVITPTNKYTKKALK